MRCQDAIVYGIGMAAYRGTVLWFKSDKGYGFIRYDGGEVFVHSRALQRHDRELRKGQIVEFEIVPGTRNEGDIQAANVIILSKINANSVPTGSQPLKYKG